MREFIVAREMYVEQMINGEPLMWINHEAHLLVETWETKYILVITCVDQSVEYHCILLHAPKPSPLSCKKLNATSDDVFSLFSTLTYLTIYISTLFYIYSLPFYLHLGTRMLSHGGRIYNVDCGRERPFHPNSEHPLNISCNFI